jgi:hypothetical protein
VTNGARWFHPFCKTPFEGKREAGTIEASLKRVSRSASLQQWILKTTTFFVSLSGRSSAEVGIGTLTGDKDNHGAYTTWFGKLVHTFYFMTVSWPIVIDIGIRM